MNTTSPSTAVRGRLNWTNLLFISAMHLLAIVAIVYLITVRASGWTIGLGVLWFALSGLAITAGYHRLFAHRSYCAAAWLRCFYLLFGAAAVQNSAWAWSADHRVHHAGTDQDEDPYNISRGFWWAHIGWVFFHTGPRETPRDLSADALVRFQHRNYLPLALLFGLALPGLIGLLWGDPLGCVLVAGVARLVVQWHATFSVNSLAHWVGRRPYSLATSARDSCLVALVSLGEGYHNFHHRFQADYRNGVRWYHFDPTKWFVWSLARVGCTWNLTRTPAAAIARARLTP